jgi:protein gp37
MRRTNEDKRRSVMTLLNDEEWRKWNSSEIARRCGVDEGTVRRLRGSIIGNSEDEPRLFQRNGQTYTMNTANIGQRTPQQITVIPKTDTPPAWARSELGEQQPSHWTVIDDAIQRKNADSHAYITLNDWRAMPPAQQAEALAIPGGQSRMNAQDTNNIEWAKWSWNPVTGCRHNCSYCYARDIAARFYPQGFEPSFLPSRLSMPRNTPVPASAAQDIGYKNVFTCSMADLFGRWVPREWIEAVLQVVADNSQWNFLFLTKFPIRLAEFDFPGNAWLGTTVDAQARVANAERAFSKVRGGVKWLSCEPLLEPLRFSSLKMFDWVVIGGASSSTQTPEFHPPRAWVESLEAQARRAGCKVYEKTNLLERIREYPGQADAAPVNVPDAFKMTYLQRDVLTPIEYQQELAV